MASVAQETAYYLNTRLPAVALITTGVRFPSGIWAQVANAAWTRPQVEQALANVFPSLKGKVLTFATLASESDVEEFERLFPAAR